VEPEILELWTRAGAIDAVGTDRVYTTVREAVNALEFEGATARPSEASAVASGHPEP
jgi:hypothetical protein